MKSPEKLADPSAYSPANANPAVRRLYSPAMFASTTNAAGRNKASHSVRPRAEAFVLALLYDPEYDVADNKYFKSMNRATFDAVVSHLTITRYGSPTRPAWEYFDLTGASFPSPRDFPDWSSPRYKNLEAPIRGKYKKSEVTDLPPVIDPADRGGSRNSSPTAAEALMEVARSIGGAGAGPTTPATRLADSSGSVVVIFERFLGNDRGDRRALPLPNVNRNQKILDIFREAYKSDKECGLFEKDGDGESEFVLKCPRGT